MTSWTQVVLLAALTVASVHSTPLLRRGIKKSKSISTRVDGDYRLPGNTVPISYVVRLNPKIIVDDFTFDGVTTINIKVLETTKTITLHSKSLTYNESLTTLTSASGAVQNIVNQTYDTDRDFLIIETQNDLTIGNYTLKFTFVGILNDDLGGFYRTSYSDESGKTVWLAATLFQATDARQAFPCYDEPALKATFDIGLKHEYDYHALSNMPLASQENDTSDGKTWSYFEETPLMSTYLVAFVVSDFASIQNEDKSYGVWSRPNAIHLAQYAFDIGKIELATIAEYVNTNFSLPKMDQIGFPEFGAAAMENWGLAGYREDYFIYDENYTSLLRKQQIATILSHELGHQWFGNLVSPAWWKYLWLNEGFATYLEHYATELSEDNWRMMDQMVIEQQQADAFLADARADSHPMNQDVASPDEIDEIFDSISYAKGGCVIRMMSHFLTEDVFRIGVVKYLEAHAYSTATSDDLFEALQEAVNETSVQTSHINVKEIMDTWVEQMGYPVVTVTRNDTAGTTVFAQERFLLGEADQNDTNDYKWWIPVNWAYQSSIDFETTTAQAWIPPSNESMEISDIPLDGWVIVNKQQTGFYRVNYDLTNWKLITDYLDSDDYLNIHVLNRAALIDDAIYLASADLLSYSVVFDLLVYLQREIDHIPWYAAFSGLNGIDRMIAKNEDYESFRNYLAILMTKVWEKVGIEEKEDDDHTTKLNRENLINYVCAYGLESCRSSAEAKLVNWLENSTANPISPNLLTNTICAGLRSANATTWKKALDAYLTTSSSTYRIALLPGLGCSEDEGIITDWLNMIVDPTSPLNSSVLSWAFEYVYQGSPYNVERAFNFLVNNSDRIVETMGNSSIAAITSGIAFRMSTESQLEEMTKFLETQLDLIDSDWIPSIAILVGFNIKWNTKHGVEINEWIETKLTEWNSTDVTTMETVTETETETEMETVTVTETEMETVTETATATEAVTTTSVTEGAVETTTPEDSGAISSFLNLFAAVAAFAIIFLTK